MNQPQQLNLSNISDNDEWSLIFGDELLPRLVGTIMNDPYFAIVELVANCWDACATKVHINIKDEYLSIEDDGISMSKDEFHKRWRDLTYNRIKEQGGHQVNFPGKKTKKRKVFGKNGIG